MMNIREDISKKELMKYEKYFIAPKFLLIIYQDDDIIPKELVEMMFFREEPKPYYFRITLEIYNEVQKLIKKEYDKRRIRTNSTSFLG